MSITIEKIIEIVSENTEVTPEQIKSKTRLRQYVEARALVSYFVKMYLPQMSLKSIGKTLGGRDHSTVIHHINMIQDFAETMPYWDDKINVINTVITRNIPVRVAGFDWEVNTTR